jgi:hypothetical protein
VGSNFRLDRAGQQSRCSIAQNISQRIVNLAWLNQAKHISIIHGVSLLAKGLAGLITSQDTPPHRFTPSPTFAVCSQADAALLLEVASCLIGVEACGTAHYWARVLATMGHEVLLIPPSYVTAFGRVFIKKEAGESIDETAVFASRMVYRRDFGGMDSPVRLQLHLGILAF